MGSAKDKGNRFEQEIGKTMLEVNGECSKWGELTTECARTGHLSDLQMDILSKTYAIEARHRKHLPKTPFEHFAQIKEIAESHGKEPALYWKKDARTWPVLCMITPERHAELLRKEREYDKIKT